MEVYYLVLCCVLFTTVASFSSLDNIPEYTNDNLALDAQSRNCQCENGRCVTDNEGHMKCVCKPGYALQDEFTCQPCDCGSLGKCIFILKVIGSKTSGQFEYQKKCVCNQGSAVKNGVCVSCDCGENSACDFDFGERRCYCIEGYSEKNGVCTRCDCGFNGKCEYRSGNKICECDEGFLELNGICTECDCGPYGTCSFQNGRKTCRCQQGYSVKNGRCEPCNCGPNSKFCQFVNGAKQCTCKDMYADRYGTCEACYCGTHSRSCSFSNNQKTCNCLEGYVQKGETCQLGCSAKNPCQNGGYCKEGFCYCQKGTRGEFCEVIEECSNLCPIQGDIKCSYDVASLKAYCRCLDSNLIYDPNLRQCRRSCVEDNECLNGGKCDSRGRGMFCDCLPGTRGDKCEIIDDCASGRVKCNGNGAYCSFNVNTKKAICKCTGSGMEYDSLSGKCRLDCLNTPCMNGTCIVRRDGREECVCPAGHSLYSGVCLRGACRVDTCFGGVCRTIEGERMCVCPEGYSLQGIGCFATVCKHQPCFGGVCHVDDDGVTEICTCPDYHYLDGNVCKRILCQKPCFGGVCKKVDGGEVCECPSGYVLFEGVCRAKFLQ